MRFPQVITARRLSLGFILGLAGLMYLATIIPQQLDSNPMKIAAWRQSHESLLWLIDTAGLQQLFSQPWFAVIVLCSALSLGVSSVEQAAIARKKLLAVTGGEEFAVALPAEKLRSIARSHGYRFEIGSQTSVKFIKYPWGYFGVVLLHAGMTLVILASAYVAVTSRQGALILVEGAEPSGRQQWDLTEHGMMSSSLPLPGKIRLEKVTVNFDKRQQPAEVASRFSITDEKGSTEALTAAINRIQHYRGLRIYHSSEYGDAFTVRFTDRRGTAHAEQIAVQQPIDPATPGYSYDFSVLWSPFQFSAKYLADREKKTMRSDNPELTVRMTDGGKEIARTTLNKAAPGILGEYRVDLLGVRKWSKLIFVDIKGMPVIFTGFAIIMLGGLIHYMTPPRELIGIMQPDGSCRVLWNAVAFKNFYREEYAELKAASMRGST